MSTVHCSWCEETAEFYLLSDRDSHNSVDHACAEHARAYAHLYRRSVRMPGAVDLRERPASTGSDDVDLREGAVPPAREGSAAEQADRTGSAY